MTEPYVNTYPEDVYAPNILLLGGTGSGKTHTIRSLIDAGLEVFVQCTEPGFREVLGNISCAQGLHWHYTPPAAENWTALRDSAQKLNSMSFKAIAEMTDINRSKYRQWFEVVDNKNDFHCQRCDKKFGDVSTWGPDRAIVDDSLSGLSKLAMSLVVGSKPAKSMADWGVTQDNLEMYLHQCTNTTKCWYILTAHTEREPDEVTGSSNITVSTLGRKLAPKIPRFFSDVINTKRVIGANGSAAWLWSTITPNMDTKARNLPWADSIQPTLKPVVEKFFSENGLKLPAKGTA